MAAKTAKKAPMSDEHKAALAQGRAEGKAVRDYLEGLRSSKPKRGRKRTPDSIRKRLDAIEAELVDASPLDELKLVQERHDLTRELETFGSGVDLSALEDRFVEVARSYSQRQGISYSSWREVGVEAAVLKRAGIARSS
ncbi:MAG: hypothetical protein MUE78_03370 [Ilumatobacteraceae bacterium]|jgi:hypothetical protein|nr:hypothetical protein [Ilumatobacteraceae bacterium]